MMKPRQVDRHSQSEDGFILLAVLFLVMLLLIGLAVAAPQMARSIQRDKELELVHRGEQYKHAIRLYYKKFGAYPTTIDQLISTNNIRFLRKRYKDPLTGKDDWRLIHLGEAKVPPMGLFGQPLIGIAGMPGAAIAVAGTPAAPAGATSASATSADSTPFGTTTVDTSDNTQYNSDSSDSGDGSVSVENAANNPSVSITGAPPAPPTPSGTTPAGTASSPFGTLSAATSTGPTFGGGPIVGVGVPLTKASLIDYKKQKHYNQWEFVYNPLEEQLLQGGGLAAGTTQPVNATGGVIGSSTSQPGSPSQTGSTTTPSAGMGTSNQTIPNQQQ
ncbi:MAG TPA: type II secretion system protein [Silvibacterium sp.]|nr:type II secretion system protein [Silvibacterium sp.]